MCKDPALISRIVKRCKAVNPGLCVSVKIRIVDTIEETLALARAIQDSGADFLTVHGRTIKERNVTPHFDYVKAIKDALSIPVFHNGGVYHPDEIQPALDQTGNMRGYCLQNSNTIPQPFSKSAT